MVYCFYKQKKATAFYEFNYESQGMFSLLRKVMFVKRI